MHRDIKLLLLFLQLSDTFRKGSPSPSQMCLTHSPAMEGVCKPARTCQSYQGFCENSGNVCCVDVYKCGGVTREKVSYFQNEEYPRPSLTGTLCSHILKVVEGVCFVRLDLHSFSLDCSSDWLSVIGADGGQAAVPSLCGDRRGQAMMIPVQERQNLILAVGVQTRGRAHWNIQATMINCGHVSLGWRDNVKTCQAEEEGEGDTRHSINVVGEEERGTREYNTSSGAMILVSRKDKQYYTWVSQRQPRAVKGKVAAKTKTRGGSQREKRKRNKKQREKKKKGASPESPRASPVQPVTDPGLPVVKIMFANQVICSGVIIHPLYVLTSAHCVANMTGLYILQEDNMVSLYQVYIYNQHASHALAVIQTLTHLPHRKICFQGLGLTRREMLVGYKKNSKRKDQMVYTRVTVNLRNQSRAVLQNVDLTKWVEGGVILEQVGTGGYSVRGIVSSTSKCEERQPEVRLISDEILGWISAVITQDTPIIPVS